MTSTCPEYPAVIGEFIRTSPETARLFRAPGRVNIIGEHTDYNDGLVMPSNLDLFTWVAIRPRRNRMVHVQAANFAEHAEFSLDDIQSNPKGGWLEYVKGVVHVLNKHGFAVGGADLVISTEIPIGGGLSSSASLETALAMAMLSTNSHSIDRQKLAWMCKEVENDFVGVSCGIMDQYIISLGASGQAMKLDCRSMEYEQIPVPQNARMLIVNSGVQHSLSSGNFNSRQEECLDALRILRNGNSKIETLRDADPDILMAASSDLGPVLFRRAKHVVTEIQRVKDARRAMVEDNLDDLGKLMNASHSSLRDDFEVSCAELDSLVETARACKGVYGARMVGAGFGGCVVSLVEESEAGSVMERVKKVYGAKLGREPWCHVVGNAGPVEEVHLS